jgi:hypothetical protein
VWVARVLSERETESVGKALTLPEGGPLTKLTLLEAESDSLVQSLLKICSLNCAKDMKF